MTFSVRNSRYIFHKISKSDFIFLPLYRLIDIFFSSVNEFVFLIPWPGYFRQRFCIMTFCLANFFIWILFVELFRLHSHTDQMVVAPLHLLLKFTIFYAVEFYMAYVIQCFSFISLYYIETKYMFYSRKKLL